MSAAPTVASAASSRREWTLAFAPIVLLAGALATGFWGNSYDDNFITYRYAKNLLAGEGLVYNAGERVLGTSAPGYAVLLAGLAWLTRPFGLEVHHWGGLVTLTAIVILAWILALSWRASRRRLALALAFATLALTSPLALYLQGSELFAVLALVVGAARLLAPADGGVAGSRRSVAAGLLLSAAICLRLDSGLAALILGLVEWGRRRRFPVAFAASGLTVLGAWAAGLWLYYGQVVPNTLGGKAALREVPYTLRQWQTLTSALPVWSASALLAGAAIGCFLLVRYGWWRRPPILALIVWVVSLEVAYRAIGVWYAPWYHLALWHALLALFAFAAVEIVAYITARVDLRRALSPPTAFGFVLTAVLALVLVPSLRFVVANWRQPIDPRFHLHQAAADYLREKVDPESAVLALEIGVLGYFGERRILDLGALVSPQVTAAKFTGRRPQLVAELAPAYILLVQGDPLMRAVLEQDGVRDRYDEIEQFRGGGMQLRLLRRRSAELTPASAVDEAGAYQ